MEAAEGIALVKGHVEHELLLRNEYLAAENEILRSRLEVPLTQSPTYSDSCEALNRARQARGVPRAHTPGCPVSDTQSDLANEPRCPRRYSFD